MALSTSCSDAGTRRDSDVQYKPSRGEGEAVSLPQCSSATVHRPASGSIKSARRTRTMTLQATPSSRLSPYRTEPSAGSTTVINPTAEGCRPEIGLGRVRSLRCDRTVVRSEFSWCSGEIQPRTARQASPPLVGQRLGSHDGRPTHPSRIAAAAWAVAVGKAEAPGGEARSPRNASYSAIPVLASSASSWCRLDPWATELGSGGGVGLRGRRLVRAPADVLRGIGASLMADGSCRLGPPGGRGGVRSRPPELADRPGTLTAARTTSRRPAVAPATDGLPESRPNDEPYCRGPPSRSLPAAARTASTMN